MVFFGRKGLGLSGVVAILRQYRQMMHLVAVDSLFRTQPYGRVTQLVRCHVERFNRLGTH